MRRIPKSVLAVLVAVVVAGAMPATAGAQLQELKLPFRSGGVQINFDETYDGNTPHPTNGAIAFDMQTTPFFDNVDILAIGDGMVRHACTHKSGSSILQFLADGYAGEFVYVHIEAATLPAWMDNTYRPVKQGDVIGRMFPDSITGQFGDACLQFSTGPHLHLDLPSLGIVMDGVAFDEDFPNDFEQLVSTNGSATCSGMKATIVGTSGDDVLFGTDGPDIIAGLQGNDIIEGFGGDDIICGGKGNDQIAGGEGFDVLFGAQGNDVIYGANDRDAAGRADIRGGRYYGGQGNDIIYGTVRWDRMQGGPGADRLLGYEGRDWMRGGAQSDFLEGGGNIDDMHGGNGNDEIVTGGGDIVRGGAGSADVCDVSRGEPTTMISCEQVVI